MRILGVIPPDTQIGVKQRLESLTFAVRELSTATAGAAPAYSIALPTPTSADRGMFAIARDANSVDTLYVCMLNSSGAYEWCPVVQSS